MNHIAGEYSDLMQHCIICGEVIIDDRGAVYPEDGPCKKGFPPGPVYQRGNLTSVGRDEMLEDCKPQ